MTAAASRRLQIGASPTVSYTDLTPAHCSIRLGQQADISLTRTKVPVAPGQSRKVASSAEFVIKP